MVKDHISAEMSQEAKKADQIRFLKVYETKFMVFFHFGLKSDQGLINQTQLRRLLRYRKHHVGLGDSGKICGKMCGKMCGNN